ncbi:testican-2-like isoform X1 [Branchiostoma floridae]|uniref:Testican-2-like isoform X1 n=1 Tax=Branchiostoma floridae TaxID=7739 RepID=C3Y784_BRAFL|nr:testican-2-like isoform X1 [Branchiostoma floridae]|eukprot:XP_002607702.1 hypothetical protein BRAFLDRAFT_82852 [Branchiostoma floridae]
MAVHRALVFLFVFLVPQPFVEGCWPDKSERDERTPCEKQRNSHNPKILPGGFIKECEADGSFKKEQCNAEGLCYCVNPETGKSYHETGMRGPLDCDQYEAMDDAGVNWGGGGHGGGGGR